jgi:hypothetical protein
VELAKVVKLLLPCTTCKPETNKLAGWLVLSSLFLNKKIFWLNLESWLKILFYFILFFSKWLKLFNFFLVL